MNEIHFQRRQSDFGKLKSNGNLLIFFEELFHMLLRSIKKEICIN